MSMENILKEPEGSPITVFQVMQYNQWKHKNSGKDDVLFIVYKDANNEKRIRMIKNPSMEIYFTKPEFRSGFKTPREYLPMDELYSKTVRARSVLYGIHDELQQADDDVSVYYNSIWNQAKAVNNRQAMKEIFKWPYTLMSDVNVEDYYRIMLGYHYNTDRGHIIDKSYLDIEADVYGLTSSEQAANMDKVNACTVIFTFDENRKVPIKPQVFTFLLRNYKRYPQQEEFEKNIDKFIEHCHAELDHQKIINKKGKEKVIDLVADYHILFYDEEKDLLQAIFDTINKYRPDTCSVWNIGYDIPKLAARMERNGMNYVNVMSDKLFPEQYRFVEMNIDKRPGIEIADKKTYIRMSSTTSYNDQMQSYGGIRKGMKAFGSSALDNISNIELGVGKHKFKKGVNVFNAAIKDYFNFAFYNIVDVMRQVLIDIVTNDMMQMIFDMNQANTSLENLTKQTRYQKQIYYTEYLRRDHIPGNNPNVNYIKGETEEYLEMLEEAKRAKEQRRLMDQEDLEALLEDFNDAVDLVGNLDDEDSNYGNSNGKSDDNNFDEVSQKVAEEVASSVLNIYNDSIDRELSIPGGLVGNPDNNTETGVELIKGVHSKCIYDFVMDMDYASEYPWAKYTRSMSKSTQIGRIIIQEKISPRQNSLPMGQQKRIQEIKSYLPGAEFTADYVSHDVVSFGNVWFNLPTVTEMNERLMEKMKK